MLDPAAIEAARLLFTRAAFERSAPNMQVLPDDDRPEIAFAGRSNVGKSSLINALANRRGLARASSEPGRTRELNFFTLGPGLRLTDLPGYGYARAPKTAIAAWNALTRDYLRGRPSLARVFLLIDSRHGVKPADLLVMDSLDAAACVYQPVLTKTDKIRPAETEARILETQALTARRPAAHPVTLACSAESGDGLDALRCEIAALAAPEEKAIERT